LAVTLRLTYNKVEWFLVLLSRSVLSALFGYFYVCRRLISWFSLTLFA
jgi:hypothetical protein